MRLYKPELTTLAYQQRLQNFALTAMGNDFDGGVSDSLTTKNMFISSSMFTILSFIAIAISYADRSNISTAIIPMADQFHWQSFFSGVVLSSFWGGYALTQVLGGTLADRFGGERLLVLALLIWSLCTGLTPFSASLGEAPLIATRVLLGAGEGLALPSVHSMIRKYVPKEKRSTSASVVTASCYLGALLGNFFAPIIIANYDWQTCFYLFAVLPTVVWLPLWLGFIKSFKPLEQDGSEVEKEHLLDHPQDDKQTNKIQVISEDRTETSSSNKSIANFEIEGQEVKPPPEKDEPTLSVWSLLQQKPIWAIIAAQYGQSWGMYGLLSWLPSYFTDQFGITLENLAYFTVLPYVLQLFVSLAVGPLADTLITEKHIRVLTVRNTLQSLGMVVPALCLMYCTLLGNELDANSALLVISFGTAMSSLTSGAVSCSQFDLSPKNAGTIFGIGNTASCVAALVAVPISGFLFDLTHSWDATFTLFAVHYVAGLALWLLWASDQPFGGGVKEAESAERGGVL